MELQLSQVIADLEQAMGTVHNQSLTTELNLTKKLGIIAKDLKVWAETNQNQSSLTLKQTESISLLIQQLIKLGQSLEESNRINSLSAQSLEKSNAASPNLGRSSMPLPKELAGIQPSLEQILKLVKLNIKNQAALTPILPVEVTQNAGVDKYTQKCLWLVVSIQIFVGGLLIFAVNDLSQKTATIKEKTGYNFTKLERIEKKMGIKQAKAGDDLQLRIGK